MDRNNNDCKKARKQSCDFALKKLKFKRLKFHKIFFGKPSTDFYVEDKPIGYKSDWYKTFDKI